MINSFETKAELSDTQERVVNSTFSIRLNGYIIPDTIQKDLTTLKKIPSITRFTVSEQVVGPGGVVSGVSNFSSTPVGALVSGYWNDQGNWNDNGYWQD
jgi:hypothetical protein